MPPVQKYSVIESSVKDILKDNLWEYLSKKWHCTIYVRKEVSPSGRMSDPENYEAVV